MIRFILVQLALGAAVGTMLQAALIALGGTGAQVMLAEAVQRPGQLAAIWLGGVAPFAVGYLATALCLVGGDGPTHPHQGSWRRAPVPAVAPDRKRPR